MGLVFVIFYLICGSTLSSHLGWSHTSMLFGRSSIVLAFGVLMDGGKLYLLGIPKDQIKLEIIFQLRVFPWINCLL